MMREKLIHDIQLLKKQLNWLEISFNECKSIGRKKSYTIEDDLIEVFDEVLSYSKELIKIMKTTLDYIQNKHLYT